MLKGGVRYMVRGGVGRHPLRIVHWSEGDLRGSCCIVGGGVLRSPWILLFIFRTNSAISLKSLPFSAIQTLLASVLVFQSTVQLLHYGIKNSWLSDLLLTCVHFQMKNATSAAYVMALTWLLSIFFLNQAVASRPSLITIIRYWQLLFRLWCKKG